MHKIIKLLFLIIVARFSFATELAVIDIDKVINSSVAYQEFKVAWEKRNLKYQNEISSSEKKMLDLDEEIRSKSDSVSFEEIDKMKLQLSEYEITIQKLIETRKGILDRSFSNAVSQIRASMMQVIENIVKQKHIEVVVSKSQTIYSDESLDITESVLLQLNKELKVINNIPEEEENVEK